MLRRKGETLIEFITAMAILAVILGMTMYFISCGTNFLSKLIQQDEYIFNAESLVNYSDVDELESALEFLITENKNDIIFTRNYDSGIFLTVRLKSSSVNIFEITR